MTAGTPETASDAVSLIFYGSLDKMLEKADPSHIVHIVVTAGSLSFQHRSTRYNITRRDYVILPNTALAREFAASCDFRALVFSLSPSIGNRLALRSNYGIIGHLSLLQNPVMRLDEKTFQRCCTDIERLKARSQETSHRFLDEMTGHLLAAHILDLYDIHAKNRETDDFPNRAADLLRRFTQELAEGNFLRHRDLDWYARRLFVSPHYLSEICRRASGRSAGYFIDLFTVQEIARQLAQKDIALARIAEEFNFSSASYFTRYVKKHLGVTPLRFRNARLTLNAGRTKKQLLPQ